MGKDETCEVCGGTESKLVDGYYYCAECGTQDTNVRETLVEHQLLEDGRFAIGRRTKYSVKMKEGVEMSPEWYKWHTYNFVLAGLTEQLVALGAAPRLRMKVLWIWSRYVKMFQKKEVMGRLQVLSQLEDRETASAAREEPEPAERERLLAALRSGPRVDRVSRQLLAAVLALALNYDRSPLQVSHFTRFVTFRLLTVNDPLRFVPPEIVRKHKQLELGLQGTLFFCNDLPIMMGRLIKVLDLGPALVPDLEALVASQLRELRLPRGLARLVRGLIHLLPIPWELNVRQRGADVPKFPDYETTVLAYIVVALKMCFGLDDDYEERLSAAVDRLNREQGRPRAYGSDPEPTQRLFSFREWSAQLRHRALLLGRQCGPLAWQRNLRASDCALMEHFEEFTTVCPHNNEKTKPLLSDEVTMDILGKIPKRWSVGVLPLEALRPAVAALEPCAALARLTVPRLPLEHRRLLDEDFTQYSLEYAYRRLALPAGDHVFEGVGDARKQYRREIGQHLVSSEGDPTIVYVKDCENKNWVKTKRPTAVHVVKDEDRDLGSPGDSRGEGAPLEREEDRKLETFKEETEGRNIFDDNFFDIKIKEEKVEIAPEPSENLNDETKDNIYDEFCNGFSRPRRESAARGVFDSDDESEQDARPLPACFSRPETIKQIMIAAYRQYIGNATQIPVRFRTTQRPPKDKSAPKRPVVEGDKRTKAWIRKRELVDGKAAIDDVVSAYQRSLATDALHQVAAQVRSFVDAAGEPDPHPDPAPDNAAGAMDADPDDSQHVQVVENEAEKDAENDGDAFDGPAYNPVYEGDVKFDDKTHDASQLFLKVKTAPRADDDVSFLDDKQLDDDLSFLDDKQLDDDAALHEQKNRARCEAYRQKMSWRKKKDNINHLVDDPESITKFNYWCKHYKFFKNWVTKLVQDEMDESFPRSFRFVLRECAAMLGVSQQQLYQRVGDVERVMLSLLWRPKRSRRRDKRKPTSSTGEPKRKISKNTKSKKERVYTSDDTSDSEMVSTEASDLQDVRSANVSVSKENILDESSEHGAAVRG